ncbi:MAG: hypothetical protein RID91_09855 [Azospirillaceae bacterium]
MNEVFTQPSWITLLFVGVTLTATMGFGAFALARAGRSPLWVLLLLVPYVGALAVWVAAYARWPRVDGERVGRGDRERS